MQRKRQDSRLRFLITAGPTREYIDSVRYISNDSSGKMGFALAAAAVARGQRVTLVHGPVALEPPAGVRAVSVISAGEMLEACLAQWPRHDVLIMAAAVADYMPVSVARTKLKKSKTSHVLWLRPTVDILDRLSRQRGPAQVVIGFALEDRNARRNAEKKLREKLLDAIVLNRPETIGADRAVVEILVAGETWRNLPGNTKPRVGPKLIRLAEELYERRAAG